jgi:NADH-quinone oxidoreductase subunit L
VPAHAHDERPVDEHELAAHPTHLPDTPQEQPWTMTAPLVILAAFAVFGGLFNLPTLPFPVSLLGSHWLADLWGQQAGEFNLIVAASATIIALVGIAAGWFYDSAFKTARTPDPFEMRLPGFFLLLHNAYSFDFFYAQTIGRMTDALARLWNWIDRVIIDGLVNAVGYVTAFLGRFNFILDDTLFNDGPDGLAAGSRVAGDDLRHATQTGRIQDYIGLVFASVVVLALIYLYGL